MDKVAEQPAVQVIDPDFHRRSQVQQILRQFGLSLQDLQELESFRKVPDMLSLAFAPDTRDEQLERIFASCLKKGHGLLFCAASVEPSRIVELIARGAQGYLQWPLSLEEAAKSLEIAQRYGAQRIAFAFREARAKAAIEILTRREKEVLAALISGRRNSQIAAEASVFMRTSTGSLPMRGTAKLGS